MLGQGVRRREGQHATGSGGRAVVGQRLQGRVVSPQGAAEDAQRQPGRAEHGLAPVEDPDARPPPEQGLPGRAEGLAIVLVVSRD